MKHRCSVKGFTLVELLVAMAVGTLLLASLLSVLSSSLGVSRKTNDALLAANAASAALDLIATDIESLAVITSGTFQHLYLGSENVGSLTGAAKLILLTSSANDTATSGSDGGQVRAVAYRLAYQDVVKESGPNKIYGIYRSAVINSGTVFTDYLGKSDLSATTLFTSDPKIDDFLAGNIVDFRVRFYPAGSLTALNLNSTDIVKINGAGLVTVGGGSASPAATAEISLTYLEDAGAKLVKAMGLEQAKKRYGYTVSKKVLLRTPTTP